VIAVVVVMIDEGADLRFQVARQIVVLQQNTVSRHTARQRACLKRGCSLYRSLDPRDVR
jgi:hypothetical protein